MLHIKVVVRINFFNGENDRKIIFRLDGLGWVVNRKKIVSPRPAKNVVE